MSGPRDESAPSTGAVPPRPGVLVRLLSLLFCLATAALFVGAIGILGLHCESFGCIGVGVAWFAWSLACLVVLTAGWILRRRIRALGGRSNGVDACLIALGVFAMALIGYRLLK